MKRTFIFSLFICGIMAVTVAINTSPTQAHRAAPDDPITYWHDVKPILDANCTTCHYEDGIALSLETYEMALDAAPILGDAVLTGYMPPWPPGGDTPHLMNSRALSPEDVTTLIRWALNPLEGDPADYHAEDVTRNQPVPLRADLILEMPVEYIPNASRDDDYRCFLIDPQLDEDMFVTGFNVVPGNDSIVHHVLLFKVPASTRSQAAAREAEDEQPGWECFGGPRVNAGSNVRGLGNAANIGNSVGAWAPGSSEMRFPAQTGDFLRSDDLIVMQVHYNLRAGILPDRTRAIFELTPATGDMFALQNLGLVAPVEIPCTQGATAANCDRDMALSTTTTEEPIRTRAMADGLLSLCGYTLADYAEQTAQAVSDCTRLVPVNGFLMGAAGHMHERGTRITIEKNVGAPDYEMLLDIPQWDFHWQGTYQYVTPIPVFRGDEITITCYWDNSDGERYIVWGEGTEDEMCLGGLTVLPLPTGMMHEEFRAAYPAIFGG